MPKERKDPERRLQLLEAGAEALGERGYHGTGIKEVLDRVRVPKGSFYNYFESKEDFVGEVVRHCAERTATALERDLDDPSLGALAVLRRALEAQTDCIAAAGFRRGCLFGNLAGEMAETSEACRCAARDALAAMRERYRVAIERGQREGEVRSDIGASELADFLLNAWEGSLLRSKVERSDAPLRQCTSLLVDRFLRPVTES